MPWEGPEVVLLAKRRRQETPASPSTADEVVRKGCGGFFWRKPRCPPRAGRDWWSRGVGSRLLRGLHLWGQGRCRAASPSHARTESPDGGAQEEVEEELHRRLLHLRLPPPSSPRLTCDLIPFQVDALQGRGGCQGLGEAPKLVAGEVDGPQVQQGPQLLGQPVQEVALQVEL